MQEHARDQQEIGTRFNAIQIQKKAAVDHKNQAKHALGTAQHSSPQLPGVYAHLDDLDQDTLALVAAQHSVREMAPLNTRGKYHTQYMHDAYPIAGSQFKLERERDLCVSAKKKLLLAANNSSSAPSLSRTNGPRELFASSYGKLDFYVDQMTQVLQREQETVKLAEKDRQVRLVNVRHEEGLQQFWRVFHTSHHW